MTLCTRGVLQNGISAGGPKGEKSRKEREDQSSNSFVLIHTHTHTHRVDSRGEKSGYILIERAF